MKKNFNARKVAEELGVSPTTVSRALSGKGRVSEETAKRIKEYIASKGGNIGASVSSAKEESTTNIAMIIPTGYNADYMSFFFTCLSGIQETCQNNGYDLIVTACGNDDITPIKRLVENHKVDGLIIARTYQKDPAIEYLKAQGIPFVSVGTSPYSGVAMADQDNVGSAMELTQIMIAKGFTHLALIGGDMSFVANRQRFEGFRLGLEETDNRLDKNLIFTNNMTTQDVSDSVGEIIKIGADCIIGMDDNLTMMILNELRRRKIVIPKMIKVASFYDSTYLEQYHPSVTSLVFDTRGLGKKAAEKLLYLLHKFDKDLSESVAIPYEVAIRESTK